MSNVAPFSSSLCVVAGHGQGVARAGEGVAGIVGITITCSSAFPADLVRSDSSGEVFGDGGAEVGVLNVTVRVVRASSINAPIGCTVLLASLREVA